MAINKQRDEKRGHLKGIESRKRIKVRNENVGKEVILWPT
jgi:hypothetical protein